MANLKDTKRGIFYYKGTEPFLSVTEILKIIDKPSLRYWFGQEVYYAMLKDPTLREAEALAAPYKTSAGAAARGKTVHSIVEAYKATGAVLTGIPEEFQGFATAFYNFMDDVRPEILAQEKSVFDEENKVGGTLDMYAKINNRYFVLDIKTGKDVYSESEIQLSAYAHMLRLEGKQVDGIGVVLLEIGDDKKPTGKYKFAERTENYSVFLAAKSLYEWTNREKLLKSGYPSNQKGLGI